MPSITEIVPQVKKNVWTWNRNAKSPKMTYQLLRFAPLPPGVLINRVHRNTEATQVIHPIMPAHTP